MKSLLERIKDRCRVWETGCWIWTQATNNMGYPEMRVASLSKNCMNVRRLVYELAVGPLTERYLVTSTCKVKTCCNPAHLKLATRAEVGTKALIEVNKLLTPNRRRENRLKGFEKSLTATWHP